MVPLAVPDPTPARALWRRRLRRALRTRAPRSAQHHGSNPQNNGCVVAHHILQGP